MKKILWSFGVLIVAAVAVVLWFVRTRAPETVDDAKAAGKTVADFPQTGSRAFDQMDGGIALTDDETMGRNTWLLWTAGDQTFWDRMAQQAFGLSDLLKTIDSRPRTTRFRDMGLVNQPGFEQATQPDEYGLWLDTGPQEDGVDPSVYGRPSGVVGLRVYPNPTIRQRGSTALERRSLLQRSRLLQRSQTRAAVRGWNVMWILPRLLQSVEAP